ncbi:Hypothetical predicted protein, partial [Pelobates cultripes]
ENLCTDSISQGTVSPAQPSRPFSSLSSRLMTAPPTFTRGGHFLIAAPDRIIHSVGTTTILYRKIFAASQVLPAKLFG